MEFTFSLLQCLLPRLAQFASRRASAPMLSPSVFLSLQEILRGVLFWSTLHLWVTDIQRTPRRRLSKGARQLTSDSPVHKTMARLACHQKRLCLPSKIFSSRLPFWLRRSRQRLVAAGRLVGCAEAAAHVFLMSFERVHPSAAATNVIDGVEPSRRPDSLQLEVRLAALFRVAPLAACPWALPVARVIPRRLCISCTYERTPVAHG